MRSAVKSTGTFRHGHCLSRNLPPPPSPQLEQAEALEAEREAIVTFQTTDEMDVRKTKGPATHLVLQTPANMKRARWEAPET